jgi:hypothetical protein
MRFSSATYRLKTQYGDTEVLMVTGNESGKFWKAYNWAIAKTGTYPHPTTGEAVFLMFVVGPVLVHFTGYWYWEYLAVAASTFIMLAEATGMGYLAYKLARRST